jgi:hypothetical protein
MHICVTVNIPNRAADAVSTSARAFDNVCTYMCITLIMVAILTINFALRARVLAHSAAEGCMHMCVMLIMMAIQAAYIVTDAVVLGSFEYLR